MSDDSSSEGSGAGRRIHGYKTTRKIGAGSFGDVYVAVNSDEEEVAIKTEHLDRKPKLEREAALLKKLAVGYAGQSMLPRMLGYDAGRPKDGVPPAMVMELLAENLEEFRHKCRGDQVPVPTLMRVYHQCITALEQVHSHGYVHRDVKPENFCLNRARDTVLLCDLGLAKAFIEKDKDGHRSHIPFSQRKNSTSIAGTARFSSLRTHIGIHQTRRDEMEALLFGVRHLAYGQLPWSGLTFTDKKEKHRVMHERKTATSLEELWGTLPEELSESFTMVRALEFAETPPYDNLRRLARMAFDAHDGAGPWAVKKPPFQLPLEIRGVRRELQPPEGSKNKRSRAT